MLLYLGIKNKEVGFMTKTIISAVVSVICTAAICITAFLCVNNYKKETAAVSNDYMTEAQAA